MSVNGPVSTGQHVGLAATDQEVMGSNPFGRTSKRAGGQPMMFQVMSPAEFSTLTCALALPEASVTLQMTVEPTLCTAMPGQSTVLLVLAWASTPEVITDST